jgi:hypothetical protein
MALKRYTIERSSTYPTDYVFDASKVTYIIYPNSNSPTLNFDYLNRLELKFDNGSQAIDWINENVLVPAAICEYECI